MKALGKKKSNREGTLLPVLSGGMSRAAVNKCVSNSGRERERERRGGGGEGVKETTARNILSLGSADDDPEKYVLTRRKLLNARKRHPSTSKPVSSRCLLAVSTSANAGSIDDY